MRGRHENLIENFNQMRTQLQKKLEQEAIFEQQKQKARQIILSQQQENEALKQANELLLAQNTAL